MSVSLRSGQLLEGLNASYELVQRLGGGKYAEVWKARVRGRREGSNLAEGQEVALKALRPGLLEDERDAFWEETEVLATLHQYEEQKKELLEQDCSLLPEILDLDLDQGFFVQTLAQGTPLDVLWREKGAFPEPEALQIAAQLLKVFQLLHEGLERSYLDFQPRNVFWNAEEKRILVIDWNLLSPKGHPAFDQDLETAAQVLYRMLMGVPLPPPGARRSLAEPRDRWQQLTLGMQDILIRALHPDRRQRYESAEKFREAIEEQRTAWQKGQQNPSVLLQMAEMLVLKDPREDPQSPRRAANYITILKRSDWKPTWEEENRLVALERRLGPWLERREWLWRGIRLFESAGYTDAQEEMRRVWDEALSLAGHPVVGQHYARIALEAARWEQAAEAILGARDTYKSWSEEDKARLKEALEYLGEEKFENAERTLRSLQIWYGGMGENGLQALLVECQLWIKLREAERLEGEQEFGKAADRLEEAQDLLVKLPYREVLQHLTGDQQPRIRALRAKAEVLRQLDEEIEKLRGLFKENWGEGFKRLRDELGKWAGSPPQALGRLLKEEIARQFQGFQWVQARALAALAADYVAQSPEREQFVAVWKQALHLTSAEEALRARDWESFRCHVDAARREARGAPWLPQSDSLTGWLKGCFKSAADRGDYPEARALSKALGDRWDLDVTDRLNALEEGWTKQREEILQQLKDALAELEALAGQPREAAWARRAREAREEARRVLDQARGFQGRDAEAAKASGRMREWEQNAKELERKVAQVEEALRVLEEQRTVWRQELLARLGDLWPVAMGGALPEDLRSLETRPQSAEGAEALPFGGIQPPDSEQEPTSQGQWEAPARPEASVRGNARGREFPQTLRLLALQEAANLLGALLDMEQGPEEQRILARWQERVKGERSDLERELAAPLQPPEALPEPPQPAPPPPRRPGALRYALAGAGGMGVVAALLLAGLAGYLLGGGRLHPAAVWPLTPTPTPTKTPVPSDTPTPMPPTPTPVP
ncbi:MAG: hypothetical protein ACP5UM_13260, partial [Anaerolineae bacterium]